MITTRCSLKCVSCSNLMQYYKEPKNSEHDNTLAALEILNKSVDYISEFRVIGGEPLMNKRYYKFLKKLNRQNLDLTIITNGMFNPNEDWKKLFRECKHIKFFVSIDGYGELNEKVRQGSDWKTVNNTVKELEKEFKVVINTVVHNKNIHGLYRLKEWIKNRLWQINILTYPAHLRIDNSDEKKIMREFQQYFDYTI